MGGSERRWNHNILHYHPVILGAVPAGCRTAWEHPSPVAWPPPETYRSMRQLCAELLPGARFRHHVMWRYSIVWTKPG